MRKTKSTDEMMAQFDTEKIGQLMLNRMLVTEMNLQSFALMMRLVCPPSLFNLNKFLTAAEQSRRPEDVLEDPKIAGALGSFFLDFAWNSYLTAMVLNIDAQDLAFAREEARVDFGEPYMSFPSETEYAAYIRGKASLMEPGRIAAMIRSRRTIRHYTIADMLDIAKVSVVTYSAYEKGDKPQRFNFPIMYSICNELNIVPDDLMLGVMTMQHLYHPEQLPNELRPGASGFRFWFPNAEDKEQKKEPGSAYSAASFFSAPMNDPQQQTIPGNGRKRVDWVKKVILDTTDYKNMLCDEYDSLKRHNQKFRWIMANIDNFIPEDIKAICEVGDDKVIRPSEEYVKNGSEQIPLKNAQYDCEWLKKNLELFSPMYIDRIYCTMNELYENLRENE